MPNLLAHESSPYLLQHAHNPVEWRPWSDEAFEEARRRDVPVFLSIGYSTCYWCHVMERESFENEEIATLLNERFVCVKLDREERPDLDDVYMAATLIMNGHGGWPMSVFLEPRRRRPFYCGTYFPPEPRHGIPDFPSVILAMSRVWTEQRDAAIAQADQLESAVREHLATPAKPVPLGRSHVADAVSHFLQTFDRANAGFGAAPKFPQPAILDFLLDVRPRVTDDTTRTAVDTALRQTLNAIVIGGLHDHLAGGFHRYCVDATWTVPHFEKMLYDNALLLRVLARAARDFGDAEYARAAHAIARYVLRDMTGPDGLFFSAQDAETDGREGLTYLWSPEQVRLALPDPTDAAFAARAFGLDGQPNFRDPHHPDEPALHVLRLPARPEQLARASGLTPHQFTARLEHVSEQLLRARGRRAQPRLDDKSITSWNGMMIGALASASRNLEAPEYLAAAERAAHALLRCHRTPDGILLRTSRHARANIPGVLEDSAFLITGLMELWAANPAAEWLDLARDVLEHARGAFFDEASGAIFDTRAGAADLFVRTHSLHDGAVPSGFSEMLHALLAIAEATGDTSYRTRAIAALDHVSGTIAASPAASVGSIAALLRALAGTDTPHVAATHPPPAPVRTALSPSPVEIYAGVDRISLGPGDAAETRILVRVAEGWHVGAAEPGGSEAAAALTPFRVDIINGEGLRAYADYPAGVRYGQPGHEVLVYTGEFEVPIALEREGEWRGTPLLAVRFQACSDRECQAPAMVELDIALDATST